MCWIERAKPANLLTFVSISAVGLPGSDLDLVLDSLYGPIYMRFLIRHDKLDESFADEICALVVRISPVVRRGV